MKTLRLLRDTAKLIHLSTNQSFEECEIEAEEIYMHVLGIDKTDMYTHEILNISKKSQEKIDSIIEKRKKDIPLSYILKKHVFYKYDFYIDDSVLIPRPETESILDEIINQGDSIFKKKNRCILLDAGCGSGCVGITIANERPDWRVYLSDLNKDCLRVSKRNSELHNQDNVGLICADWLSAFGETKVDFIFSNPPYISKEDDRLDNSVLFNEPHSALFSPDNGLGDIKKIIESSVSVLTSSGVLFLENGVDQSDMVCQLLESYDFTDISVHLDYNGQKRFTSSRKK